MNEEKIIKNIEYSQSQMRLGNLPEYSQSHYKDIQCLLDLYNQEKETSHYLQNRLDEANAKLIEEKEKNKKLEEAINNLAKAVKFMGTNEELTTEDIIKMFSPKEIKIDFDDFMKRWENEQHKKANLKDKVIDMMAEELIQDGIDIKEYYFKKARGEENV